jgi:hypothetical protein
MVNGQQTIDNGQQTTDNGQRTMDNGQRTMMLCFLCQLGFMPFPVLLTHFYALR